MLSVIFALSKGILDRLLGKADHPDLTIDFKDSLTGAKLFTKGDVAALMTAIQDGDVKIMVITNWYFGLQVLVNKPPAFPKNIKDILMPLSHTPNAPKVFDGIKQKMAK